MTASAWGLQELSTAARYRLNMTVAVLADGCFANVRRIQRRVFGHQFAIEVVNPDFQALATAFAVGFDASEVPVSSVPHSTRMTA